MVSQDKKVEILMAASSCFARYGYEKTTLDDIGSLVGLNKASLYYYYKNKETIFSEVIFFEADEFLNAVLAKVENVKGCKEEVLTYLRERLGYIRNVVNLHKLTIESLQRVKPMFDELYKKTMEKEIAYLSELLERGIKNGEIVKCDVKRVAGTILTVAEAIKNKSAHCADCVFTSDINYTEVLNEVIFTAALIMDGLKEKGK